MDWVFPDTFIHDRLQEPGAFKERLPRPFKSEVWTCSMHPEIIRTSRATARSAEWNLIKKVELPRPSGGSGWMNCFSQRTGLLFRPYRSPA